jgi:soluble lytic murein transglycosylase-like protein
MSSAADALVSRHPTREKQLRGPVLKYLLSWYPFSPLPQDLWMANFYPRLRKAPPSTALPKNVRKSNPGIDTIQDYLSRVKAVSLTRWKLTPAEEQALRETANKVGVSRDNLYKLIGHESGWNPKARNPIGGARGLLQFIPSTAEALGYHGGPNPLILVAGAGLLLWLRRKK